MANSDKVFTKEITNETLTIQGSWGVRLLAINNNTSVSGTITGTAKLGSTSSGALTIAENKSVSIPAVDGEVLGDVTITAPAGCTLQIIAMI